MLLTTPRNRGDPKIRARLRFDVDGDGEIWSPAKLNFRQVTTDNVGAKAFLDSDNNLYIQATNSSTKKAVTDRGGLTTFDFESEFEDEFSDGKTINQTGKTIAVEAFNQGDNTYHKILGMNI